MLRFRRVQWMAVLTLGFFTAGCASMRSVSVGSDPAATYAIEVTNTMPHSMNISWSDGGEEKSLGSVPSGRAERFVIAGAKTPRITVTARDANRTHSRPYTVDLVAGSTQRISIR